MFFLQCKKSSKRLPNCLMRTETIVVLKVCNGLLCDVRDYTVIVFYRSSTWIKYQKIRVSLISQGKCVKHNKFIFLIELMYIMFVSFDWTRELSPIWFWTVQTLNFSVPEILLCVTRWHLMVLAFDLHTPQFYICWLFPTFLSKKWSDLTLI